MARAGFAILTIEQFRAVLLERLGSLRSARGDDQAPIVMPIALCLVAPENLGGDAIAKEMILRFDLLSVQSRTTIDFYYFGWSIMTIDGERMNFDRGAFGSCCEWLFEAGVKRFGGNADLVIVDAHLHGREQVSLDFTQAIRVDLALAAKTGRFDTLGDFLGSLLEAARAVASDEQRQGRPVFHISDALALTKGWELLLEKLLALAGVRRLEPVIVRNLGPVIDLAARHVAPKSNSV